MLGTLKEFTKRQVSDKTRLRIGLVSHVLSVTKTRAAFQERRCIICGFTGYFSPAGLPVRHEAACPRCHSLERHRLFKVWLERNLGALMGKRVLHFAPETAVADLVRPIAREYVTADIEAGFADRVIDIEQIDDADQSFDVVLCFHVLEHVNDRTALPELHRVLRSRGRLLLMTPVVEGWRRTYENPSIQSAEDRELHFGQRDHVRVFGADLRERIVNAGFRLSEFTAEEPEVSRYGLLRGEKVFVCDKS